MTNTTVREVHGDERLEAMYVLRNYAFRSSPPLPDKAEWQEQWRSLSGFTYVALFEDGVPVAGAAASRMTQQVRGALYPAGGVWDVATLPAARRKGYARRVLAYLLSVLRESGQLLSYLYPFRESFYERLGYVTFPLPRKVRLTPTPLTPLLKQDLGGEVEMMLVSDGSDMQRDYLRRHQQRVHGMALFDLGDRTDPPRHRGWLALARVAGQVVGLMQYDLQGESVAEFAMRVRRFYYHTSQGRYLLLQWIARHVDQANLVEIWLPPFEQPETWLADIQVKTESVVRAPMGRVGDVARLSGMQTGTGRFAARISDPLCPWNVGAWQFETVDGALRVSPTDRADCDLTIQAMGTLVFGTHDPADWTIRGWGDPSLELQDTLRTMFPARVPYLHEAF